MQKRALDVIWAVRLLRTRISTGNTAPPTLSAEQQRALAPRGSAHSHSHACPRNLSGPADEHAARQVASPQICRSLQGSQAAANGRRWRAVTSSALNSAECRQGVLVGERCLRRVHVAQEAAVYERRNSRVLSPSMRAPPRSWSSARCCSADRVGGAALPALMASSTRVQMAITSAECCSDRRLRGPHGRVGALARKVEDVLHAVAATAEPARARHELPMAVPRRDGPKGHRDVASRPSCARGRDGRVSAAVRASARRAPWHPGPAMLAAGGRGATLLT